MKAQKSPLVFTIVIWAIWLVITLGGGALHAGSEGKPLTEMLNSSIGYALIAASIFITAVVAVKNWWRETGMKGPDETRDLRYAILPAILILIALVGGLSAGAPTSLLWIPFVNTVFVGFSEELAFRGVLLHGLSSKYSLFRAAIIVSVVFGLVHALNGFITGDFGQAITQASINVLSGLWYTGVRIRNKSIFPIMILHILWDFSALALTLGAAQNTAEPSLFAAAIPVIVTPILWVYGAWLVWGLRKDEKAIAA